MPFIMMLAPASQIKESEDRSRIKWCYPLPLLIFCLHSCRVSRMPASLGVRSSSPVGSLPIPWIGHEDGVDSRILCRQFTGGIAYTSLDTCMTPKFQMVPYMLEQSTAWYCCSLRWGAWVPRAGGGGGDAEMQPEPQPHICRCKLATAGLCLVSCVNVHLRVSQMCNFASITPGTAMFIITFTAVVLIRQLTWQCLTVKTDSSS